LWDTRTGQKVHTLQGRDESWSSAIFSPDGKQVVTSGWGGFFSATLWDAQTGQELRTFQGPRLTSPLDRTTSPYSASFSLDGKFLLITPTTSGLGIGFRLGETTVWDVPTGRKLRTIQGSFAKISPDSKQVLAVEYNLRSDLGRVDLSTPILRDVGTGNQLLSLQGRTDDAQTGSFSPDGKSVCIGSARTGTSPSRV
jgi:WD40 repeat protein